MREALRPYVGEDRRASGSVAASVTQVGVHGHQARCDHLISKEHLVQHGAVRRVRDLKQERHVRVQDGAANARHGHRHGVEVMGNRVKRNARGSSSAVCHSSSRVGGRARQRGGRCQDGRRGSALSWQ